jgi:hypothetical protein
MSDKLFAAVIDWTEDRESAILALPVYNVPHFSAFFLFTRKFTKRRRASVYKLATI